MNSPRTKSVIYQCNDLYYTFYPTEPGSLNTDVHISDLYIGAGRRICGFRAGTRTQSNRRETRENLVLGKSDLVDDRVNP